MDTIQSITDQFNALKPLAEKKRVVLNLYYNQRDGHHFTMRDASNGELIGRYGSFIELDDALTNWVDDPNKDI